VKKLLLVSLLGLAGLVRLPAQTVVGTDNLTFLLGIMSDSQGVPVTDGSLLQIVASYHGSAIAAATPTDFLGGDTGATVLWQGVVDSNTAGGLTGASIVSFNIDVYADGTTGNYLTSDATLYARWYPSLTTSDSVPGATSYGQYGYSSVGGTLLDSTWVLPAAGLTAQYSFVTVGADSGSSIPDSAGVASNATAVPEPATTAAMLGGLGLTFGWFIRRKRR